MNKLEELANDVLKLQRKVNELQQQVKTGVADVAAQVAGSLGAVINFARNGDFSYSENHYNDAAPPSGADDEKEAAHWYTHTAGTTTLVEATAQAVCSTGHTVNNPAGAADPAWDRVNGWLQWGSSKSVEQPLARKMAQPSKFMYVGLVARKRTAGMVIPAGLKLGIGIHDNTAGQRKYLTGGQFNLTATVIGTPGATTSRKYKIVAITDWGESYESDEETVAGAPADASYITNQVYVALSWTKVIGVTRYEIYRLTGATYVLAGEIFDGKTTFNEMNNYLKTVAGYPATSGTNARAYVQIKFDDLTTDWEGYVATIPVPQTYDSSVTTDKQWVRFTLSQALAGGSERGIEIDKVYVSWNFGNWAPAPEDASAKQEVDTAATSGTQGGSGTGGGGGEPDPGFGGRCVWELALVQCVDPETRRAFEIFATEVTVDHLLASIDETGKRIVDEIEEILDGWASRLYFITADNGAQVPCSPSHPLIQALGDIHGKQAALLREGESMLTLKLDMERAEVSPIAAWEFIDGRFRVRIFRMKKSHLFVAGGAVSHNLKIQE